ncbi:MAG: signal peptidase II [Rhodobacteraceae bacterium]|nr:signal peptidase II [Paracoccaceae bacterium]MYG10879.1 signal peptidase II [Paracoccaceae bacterium]
MGRLILISLVTLGIDQFTKYLIYYVLDLEAVRRMVVIPTILNFHLAWNEGINFGLFGGGGELTRYIWIALALVIVVCFYIYAFKQDKSWHLLVPIGLITGGALGNTFDRVIYGAVMDYLNVTCCGINNPYSFNVADTAIFCGLALMLLFGNKYSKSK